MSLLLSKTMREHEIRPYMGSISSPWDNAAMESLMGIVKSECVHALGYMSPAEFEGANWPDDEGRPRAA